MNIDFNFQPIFEIEHLAEVSGDLPRYYYPGASPQGGKDGVMVKVAMAGKVWIGIFAAGVVAKNGFSGIYAMPDAERFCVVSNGAGYIVFANNPENWEEVNSAPIWDVKISLSKSILIFADYTELVAYGRMGIFWKTERLSFDGLKLTGQDNDFIYGEFYDLRSGKMESFKIDLENGENLNEGIPL